MKRFGALLSGVALLALAACGGETKAPLKAITAAEVDGAAIIAADQRPDIWISHGRTYSEQRYSPLKQISTENVKTLGLAWSTDLDTNRGMESTPIVVDGVMYVTSAWSVVYAYDAKTGERMWKFDPEVDKARGVSACCDVVNRGVAIWEGKVFVGTIDGRLIALDAKTGEKKWEQVTVDQSKPYTITGAPRVINGKVMIGNGGAEFGVRGYITAYNADDGKQVWRFYTTPNPTKQPRWRSLGQDLRREGQRHLGRYRRLDRDWRRRHGVGRHGLRPRARHPLCRHRQWLAVEPRACATPPAGTISSCRPSSRSRPTPANTSGTIQTTPGETWDYTATQSIILADIKIGDKVRKVAMQAPKNGFFYVLDRATGELISADKFQDNVNWATHVDLKTGRPVEAPGARYLESPFAAIPGPLGSHNWHPMAFSPDTGLVYIPAQTIPQIYADQADFAYRPGFWNTGVEFAGAPGPTPTLNERLAGRAALKGQLVAWDPVAKKARWTVDYPNAWNGGVLATGGGLVFQGGLDGTFRAYDAAKGGAALWEANGQYPVMSGPMSYEIDGEQYIAVTSGWGTALPVTGGGNSIPKVGSPEMGRVLVYKIGGKATLPDYTPFQVDKIAAAEDFGSAAQLEHGRVLYDRNCMVCHGGLVVSSGVITDLRWSQAPATKDGFAEIVLDGKYASAGMASFAKTLNPADAESIRAYIVNRSNEDAAAIKAAAAAPK